MQIIFFKLIQLSFEVCFVVLRFHKESFDSCHFHVRATVHDIMTD